MLNKKEKIAAPRTCLLTVTNQCCLRCRMCRLWKLDTIKDEVNIEDCRKFVDALGGFGPGPMEVHLIGGEALTKNGIFDLIRHISAKGWRTVMTSSGYTIDEPTARALVEAGLSMLNLSLESMDPSVHDHLRGQGGCFSRLMEAIRHLGRHKNDSFKLGINSVISAANLEDIAELAEWVQGNDILDSIYFMAVMRPFGSGADWDWFKQEEYRHLWPSDPAGAGRVLDRLIRLKEGGSSKIENPAGQLESFKSYFRDPSHFIRSNRCNVSEQAVNVNAVGDMYICFFMEKLGNIRTDNVVELWYSEKADEIRRKMRACRSNCELVVNCYYENER
ncbi:MAG: radical SAM protein [Candidatus Omnitrophica bacterium]|nr:radical SAM protein [Candidatus Omnitrophota bacterium]